MRKIISLTLMLSLIMSMGVTAFAQDNIVPDNAEGKTDSIEQGSFMENNYGTIEKNEGDLKSNHYLVEENSSDSDIYENLPPATVEDNKGAITNNYGTVKNNKSYVAFNYSGAVIENNLGDVQQNEDGAKVLNNTGTVFENHGTVVNTEGDAPSIAMGIGIVIMNFGHVSGGIVDTNYPFATVADGATVRNQMHAMFIDSELAQMTDNEQFIMIPYPQTMDIWEDIKDTLPGMGYYIHNGKYYFAMAADNSFYIRCSKPLTVSPAGSCTLVNNGDGTYTLSKVTGNFTLSIAKSSVPATGDMSNMPLWGALLLGFAALALVTRRKKA